MAILKVANVHHDASGFTRTQTTTANTIAWFTSNIEQTRLDPRGNVGIGTATPNEKLVVSDNRERVRTSILNTNTVTGSIGDVVAFSNNSNQFTLVSSSAGGGGGLSSHNPTGLTIQTIGPAYANTPIAFRTNNSERVRIDGLGRVGIGTASPTSTLDVVGTTQTSYLTIGTNQTLPESGAAIYRPVTNSLAFVTQSTERMRITSLGRVGVGRGDPGFELDVVGTVNASSILQNGGLLTSISNSYAVLVGQSANSRASQVGLSANAYAEQVGVSANAYSDTKVSSISGAAGRITVTGGTTPVINLATTGAGAASYSSGISAITIDSHGRVTSVSGSANYLTSISSAQIISALGYTPYNSTNPNGYVTSSGSVATFTSTTQDSRFNSVGIGTNASGTTGEIRATNNITAYYSDGRLKKIISTIPNAVQKVQSISGVIFVNNETAAKYGYGSKKEQVGVIAQEVEAVLPQIVVPAPFDIGQDDDGIDYSISGENYKTVQYEKLVPLLIEAIKELKAEIDLLKKDKE